MLFNSYSFIFLYLPLVLGVFFGLARWRHSAAAAWLALASLFFYGYWNPAFVALLMASIVGNYVFGLCLAHLQEPAQARRSKQVLVVAITANLLLLGYYKYMGFFLSVVGPVVGFDRVMAQIVLPLGISFFTFTQIAFLVDTWRREVKQCNFVHYVLFVTYFPHLIAGPVLHHRDIMPQFANPLTYRVQWANVSTGLLLFTLGLVKKVLWADELAPFASGIFDGISAGAALGKLPTTYEAWAGALAYTLQIYFDFSGYTDMALGIALMFNIRLPINFNAPYQATSIIEFWRRWHITLSTFLRDYLYIPLGGSRRGPARRYVNLAVTMVLGGLWHGAGWTFLVWGALHGAYLIINHGWQALMRQPAMRPLASCTPRWLGRLAGGLLTFVAVVTAWVVFRASDMTQALVVIKAMFGVAAQPMSLHAVTHGQLLVLADMSGRSLVLLLVPGLLWVWLLPNATRLRFASVNSWATLAQAALVITLLCVCLDRFGSYSPFLYFQF